MYRLGQQTGLGVVKYFAAMGLMIAYARSGNWNSCREIAGQTAAESQERSLPGIQAYAEYFLELCDIQAGDLDSSLVRLQGTAQAAAEMKYIWIELRARLAIAQTLANLKRDNHPEIERLLVLIEHLETHSQQSPFREALVSFRRTVLHSLGLAG